MISEHIYAADPVGTDLGTIGGGGLGPFGNIGSDVIGRGSAGAVSALTKVTQVVSSIIGIMTIAALIWFIFQFLVGGLNWLTSGGDKGKLQQARDRITNAFIGLVIVIAGWAILALVGMFFGFDTLIDPATVIQQLELPGSGGTP